MRVTNCELPTQNRDMRAIPYRSVSEKSCTILDRWDSSGGDQTEGRRKGKLKTTARVGSHLATSRPVGEFWWRQIPGGLEKVLTGDKRGLMRSEYRINKISRKKEDNNRPRES